MMNYEQRNITTSYLVSVSSPLYAVFTLERHGL